MMDGILPGYPAPTSSSEGTDPRPLLADKPNLEARWVLAAQAGYSLAFDELVARNQDRIYRLAANITGNQSDAKDAVRATFIKAREHLQAFRIDSRFSAWVCRIGAIEALLRLRGRYPREATLDHSTETESELMRNEFPYCADNPCERDAKAELKQLAAANTNIFKPICRLIFFLCDLEKWSVGETADFLGLPASAVAANLPRTRQEISEHLNRKSRELNHVLPGAPQLLDGAQRESIMREQLVAQQYEAATQLVSADILPKRKAQSHSRSTPGEKTQAASSGR
jgi:RNA polymerase sigma factor (sigma-70 family)